MAVRPGEDSRPSPRGGGGAHDRGHPPCRARTAHHHLRGCCGDRRDRLEAFRHLSCGLPLALERIHNAVDAVGRAREGDSDALSFSCIERLRLTALLRTRRRCGTSRLPARTRLRPPFSSDAHAWPPPRARLPRDASGRRDLAMDTRPSPDGRGPPSACRRRSRGDHGRRLLPCLLLPASVLRTMSRRRSSAKRQREVEDQ